VTKGLVYLLLSALTFSLSTAFAKLITSNSEVPAVEITFFRFLLGFVITLLYVLWKKQPLKPNKLKYILLRAFFNTTAVILFFIGIQYSTITKANMLNMTYPIFVFLISPFLNREKTSGVYYLFLILTMAGLYFIVVPDASIFSIDKVNRGDVFALASGLLAGFAITSLRQARKYDSSYLILFYLMALGSIFNLIIVIPVFVIPEGMIALYVILCAGTAVTGQIFITVGYKYIDAAAGSLVSSTRIIFSLALGVIIFSDPLTFRIIAGGILIILSLFGVSGIWEKGYRRYFIKRTR